MLFHSHYLVLNPHSMITCAITHTKTKNKKQQQPTTTRNKNKQTIIGIAKTDKPFEFISIRITSCKTYKLHESTFKVLYCFPRIISGGQFISQEAMVFSLYDLVEFKDVGMGHLLENCNLSGKEFFQFFFTHLCLLYQFYGNLNNNNKK